MQAIIDFIREVDRLKGIERKTKPLGLERYENSAEHSWQLAVMVLSLSRFSAAPINELRTIKMLLLHDIGEIDTGDTIVYATAIREEKQKEERAAVERICGMLPADLGSEFIDLWQEFEAGETPEAKFAHAMDRTVPIILNLANNGQSWRENGIRYEQVIQRNGPAAEAGCPALWLISKKNWIRRSVTDGLGGADFLTPVSKKEGHGPPALQRRRVRGGWRRARAGVARAALRYRGVS